MRPLPRPSLVAASFAAAVSCVALASGVVATATVAEAQESSPPRSSAGPIAGYPDFEIVESAPLETTLDHPDIRNADVVWLEMIRGATLTLDFAEFYASNEPGERLEDIVSEIQKAAARGVKVRFLSEDNFYRTYPETIDRLAKTDGIETRLLDLSKRSGGVLNAMYFIADSRDVFLGSQNFDWRSLEHIYELGVRIQDKAFARDFSDLFGRDWALADTRTTNRDRSWGDRTLPRPAARPIAPGDSLVFIPVMSPEGWIPDSTLWDEAHIVDLIDGAKSTVSVQVLTYRPISDNEYYPALEDALRRAAARGVKVRLLVSDWCKRKSTIPYIKSLAVIPNIEVKMMTIPQWSGGFI